MSLTWLSRRRGVTGDGSRRRGAALEADLLDAAWEELAEVGYARLTMEGVAARARTGKQVLYRRWPNRAQLVRAVVRRRSGALGEQVPDTGELRGDVLAVLREMVERQRELGPDVIPGLLAEVPDVDPDFARIMRGVLGVILERAVGRGEIGSGELPGRVVSLPADLLRHEMLLGREPVSEQVLVSIVDDVFLPLVRRS